MILKLEDLSKEKLIDLVLNKERRIEKLEKEKEKLERELKKYKNANTPSSAHRHIRGNTQGLKAKKGARRGAPLRHKGSTLFLPYPEETILASAKKCPECGSKKLAPTGYIKKRKMIRLFITRKITQYEQQEARCENGHLILPQHHDLPDQGIYDKKIVSLVNYLKFKARVPHNIITDLMRNVFNIPMTDTTSLNIIKRTSERLEPEYEQLGKEIKQQKLVGADETSLSVLGVNHWVWVFCNNILSFFKIHNKRGGDIVQQTLGKNFQGSLISDGWKTYTVYCHDNKIRHGRCWAHAKREVEFECKNKHADLYKWYCDIYKSVKKARACKRERKIKQMHNHLKADLERWIGAAKARTSLRKLATKLENGGSDWLTCIIYPEIPMDNNESERSIRPFVILEKIMGCLRSEGGKKVYEIMMSLISTWQKQQKNQYYILQTLL